MSGGAREAAWRIIEGGMEGAGPGFLGAFSAWDHTAARLFDALHLSEMIAPLISPSSRPSDN
jgi:hypothetical protein